MFLVTNQSIQWVTPRGNTLDMNKIRKKVKSRNNSLPYVVTYCKQFKYNQSQF